MRDIGTFENHSVHASFLISRYPIWEADTSACSIHLLNRDASFSKCRLSTLSDFFLFAFLTLENIYGMMERKEARAVRIPGEIEGKVKIFLFWWFSFSIQSLRQSIVCFALRAAMGYNGLLSILWIGELDLASQICQSVGD